MSLDDNIDINSDTLVNKCTLVFDEMRHVCVTAHAQILSSCSPQYQVMGLIADYTLSKRTDVYLQGAVEKASEDTTDMAVDDGYVPGATDRLLMAVKRFSAKRCDSNVERAKSPRLTRCSGRSACEDCGEIAC